MKMTLSQAPEPAAVTVQPEWLQAAVPGGTGRSLHPF